MHSVNKNRREQYSSGRRAVQLGLSSLNVNETSVLFDDRRPVWPMPIVGSIAHSYQFAVALIGFKQDFRGVGIDILPKHAVSDRVKNRILLESELELVNERESKDWQTLLFCAKESIYKASNPITDEFLGFKDVCVRVEESGTEFKAQTTSQKRSSDIITCGKGYFFEVETHWLTMFLIH